MSGNPVDFWTDETSVIFTSFWGWSPEDWGTIGWTGDQGLSRRTNLLQELTDPFISVIYVTNFTTQPELRGKIVGFYLVSHETGHRDDFTHPCHHDLSPGKWEHSLRALRAFDYVPEYRMAAAEFDPLLANRARAVTKWGEVLTDRAKISLLRELPWVERDIFIPSGRSTDREEEVAPLKGFNRAGPANRNGYFVSSSAQELKRRLYVLRLDGGTDAFLGKAANGKRIYKIGLSASPELRRQSLQSALPAGVFQWFVDRHSGNPEDDSAYSFEAAVAGEDTIKQILSESSEWLGGEFYLASEADIDTAWGLGVEAATKFQKG